MNKRNWMLGVGVAGILAGAATLNAEDWPQWRGAHRDAKVTGFSVPKQWPKEMKKAWTKAVGTGDSTPAVVDGKIYVFAKSGGNETLYCLNAADGMEVWHDSQPASAVSGPDRQHDGPRSSPTVADGKVVFLSVGGELSCLDAKTGKEAWRNKEYTKAVPRFHTACSPLVEDGVCIVMLGGGRGMGLVAALNVADGSVKWTCPADSGGYSSPVLMEVGGTKMAVVVTDQGVIGIGLADGKPQWRVGAKGMGMAGYNAPTPVIDGAMVIYSGQGSGTSAVTIEKKGDGFAATPAWTNKDMGSQFSTAVLRDGKLYGLSDKGFLFCLDAKTGARAWMDTTKHSNFGSIVDAGDVLVALPSDGDMIVYKPSADAYSEMAKIKVGQNTFAYPVLQDKRIFVRNAGNLDALDVE